MIRILCFVAFLVGGTGAVSGQYRREISKEMDRLDAEVAVLLQRPPENIPVWNSNSDSIYVSLGGYWYALEVSKLSLVKTEIAGKKAGWNQNEILEPAPNHLDGIAKLLDNENIMHFHRKEHISVRITANDAGNTLSVSSNNEILYQQKSSLETYLFPSISPDGKYLAFIGDRNGLMLVPLSKEKQKRQKLDKILNKGIAAMNDNKCATSMKFFRKALAIDSTNGTALHNLALCQFNLNLLDDLETTLKSAIRHHPEYFENFEIWASLHYLKGNYDEAAKACEDIMAAHPYYYENYYLLLATYEALEDLQNICRVLKAAQNARLDNSELKAYYLSSCN